MAACAPVLARRRAGAPGAPPPPHLLPPAASALRLPQLVGNVGLVFTKGDLSAVRKEIESFKVGAPARVGLVAPIDVIVPAGGTGMDPSQTSFFQVLNIATKINKGA